MTTLLHNSILKKSHFPDPLISITKSYLTDDYVRIIDVDYTEYQILVKCPLCGGCENLTYVDHASKPFIMCCAFYIDTTCDHIETVLDDGPENIDSILHKKFKMVKIDYILDQDISELVYDDFDPRENTGAFYKKYNVKQDSSIYGENDKYCENGELRYYDDIIKAGFIYVDRYSANKIEEVLYKKFGEDVADDYTVSGQKVCILENGEITFYII